MAPKLQILSPKKILTLALHLAKTKAATALCPALHDDASQAEANVRKSSVEVEGWEHKGDSSAGFGLYQRRSAEQIMQREKSSKAKADDDGSDDEEEAAALTVNLHTGEVLFQNRGAAPLPEDVRRHRDYGTHTSIYLFFISHIHAQADKHNKTHRPSVRA